MIETYLAELRRALEAQDVTLQREALDDAREFLAHELDDCRHANPELSEAGAFDLVVRRFGDAETVARAYADAEGDTLAVHLRRSARRLSYAPGWKVECTRCGRSADLASSAPFVARLGARALFKRTVGWCRDCRRPRIVRLWRASA